MKKAITSTAFAVAIESVTTRPQSPVTRVGLTGDRDAEAVSQLGPHVGEHHRQTERAQVDDDVEGARVEQLLERVVEDEGRGREQRLVVVELGAKPLQGGQVVGASELVAQLGEARPVALAPGDAEIVLEPDSQIGCEAVVVEQGIVDIEQEHDRSGGQHGAVSSRFGSCQPCSLATTALAVAGPQVPGS